MEDPGPIFKEGFELYRKRYFDEAIVLIKKAIEINNKESNYWFYLGLCYYYSGKFTDAEMALENAYKLDGRNVWILFFKGEVEAGLEKYDAAIQTYDLLETIEMETDEFYGGGALYDAFLTRARIYEKLGEFDKAISDYVSFGQYSGKRYVTEREIKRLRKLR